MKILGIESSAMVASAAIWEDGVLTAEYTVNHKKTHSQTLLPMIDEICRMTEQDAKAMDAVAVAAGPGSFTGLRIGSATAKGLGLALGIPLIPVPTLDAMAYQCFDAESLICPVMDARRGQVYNGLYRFEGGEFRILVPSRAVDMAQVIDEVNKAGGPVVFLGDGVPVHRETIVRRVRAPFYLAPAVMNRQRAGAVASLGAELYEKGVFQEAGDHAPEYLRPSQAERVREEKQAAQGDKQ
ncbi:MAG: tRNA (adenosine(37)-N6)-threonylcarbamoyltransferase complex dimerization subunit type 1 TsaB [Lachnospiraceae bacterium]|jgi:tRNA threonylcarbamoyladenosine biosynthesis protein TsaB|nr:tRNA (adenosine(37)-N6)-threonylcarbamoyltransferase complex dimerization subunit type 1 TsaB [Lachnospiraceae bacterium]